MNSTGQAHPETVLSPLRKKNAKTGELYRRFEKIETFLNQLLALSREAIVLRCEIDDESNADFVPSECLVHLVRSCRDEQPTSYFERLYIALMKRILLRLPPAESKDHKRLYLKESRIQEGAIDSFQELLALDRTTYEERLDFWEVAFGMALKKLTVTIQDKVWRETNRSKPLEHPETGEILAHVVEAAGISDPFGNEELFKKDYREQLPAAINSLAPDKRRIINMCLEGFPIDSIDPNVVTISKALNLSEKTVRTKKKEGLAAMKKFLEKGDIQ